MSIDRRVFLTITAAAASYANVSRTMLAAHDVRATAIRHGARADVATLVGCAGRCAASRGARSWHAGFVAADFAP